MAWTDEEVRSLLNEKQWTKEMIEKLIEAWNEIRTDLPNIGRNSVRTPCRLRQVVGSFKNYLDNQNKVVS